MTACPGTDNCQIARSAADEAADKAVEKVFAILGVDINDPAAVEEFRKDLRAAQALRKAAEKGLVALVAVAAAGFASALWVGVQVKMGR